MVDSKLPKHEPLPIPITISIALTALIFVLGLMVFCLKRVWDLKGNEIGDFFAGFAGALSFIWIIATIFLQKEELSLQRQEVTRLADEAQIQASALMSTARTNFQSRWISSISQFLKNRQQLLYDLNKEHSEILIQNEAA